MKNENFFDLIKDDVFEASADTPMGDMMMADLWNQCAGTPVGRSDIQGLDRLHRSIHRAASRKKHGAFVRFALIAVASVAALAVIFNSPKTETKVVTAQGARGSYTMPDGTVVHLNGGSTLAFDDSFNDRERKASISGSAYFDVAKNPDKPFILSLDNINLKVLGTSFTVVNDSALGKEEVILRSGSVDAESRGKHVLMTPGDRISYGSGGLVAESGVNASQLCRWWEDCLIFDNVPLPEVLSSLELRYQVEIRDRSHISPDTRLSMTVTDESLNDVMSMLAMLLPVRYQLYDKTILITNE